MRVDDIVAADSGDAGMETLRCLVADYWVRPWGASRGDLSSSLAGRWAHFQACLAVRVKYRMYNRFDELPPGYNDD